MATKSIWKSKNLIIYDDRYPSILSSLWKDCPLLAWYNDPSIGTYLFEDFNNYHAATLAGYTATQATSGTFTLGDEEYGTAVLNAGASTQHKGINVQKNGLMVKPAAGKTIWFECRFKATNPTKLQGFIGLASTDTTLMPSGVMDSSNSEYIGAGSPTTAAGVAKLYGCKATTEGTVNSIFTFGTSYITFAMKIDGISNVYYSVDNVVGSNTLGTSYIPTNALTPSFICQSDGVSQPTLTIDYYRVFQLR